MGGLAPSKIDLIFVVVANQLLGFPFFSIHSARTHTHTRLEDVTIENRGAWSDGDLDAVRGNTR